eukprot:TRINITY_DN42302_c0_g1_i1.p1 TRINITY_DN42302_c0_g1~~TRINITY_DN42302_c0_g1_i1.p1  ORF type:complete len:421 (-),score=45.13 TRINITY_DN42302_c0_g1_i1:36-1298(-)
MTEAPDSNLGHPGSPVGRVTLETVSKQLCRVQEAIDQLPVQLASVLGPRGMRPKAGSWNNGSDDFPFPAADLQMVLPTWEKRTKIHEAWGRTLLSSYPRHQKGSKLASAGTSIDPVPDDEACSFRAGSSGPDDASLDESGMLEAEQLRLAEAGDGGAAGTRLTHPHDSSTTHVRRPSVASNSSQGLALPECATLQVKRPSWMSAGSQASGHSLRSQSTCQSQVSSCTFMNALPNVVEQSDAEACSSHDNSVEFVVNPNHVQMTRWSLRPNTNQPHALNSRELRNSFSLRREWRNSFSLTKSMTKISLHSLSQLEVCLMSWLRAESPLHIAWDIVMISTISTLSFMLPFQAVYLSGKPFEAGYQVFRLICDASFLADVVLNLVCPWSGGDLALVTLPKSVRTYTKPWLCVDILDAWHPSLA